MLGFLRSPLGMVLLEIVLLEAILTFKATFRQAREDIIDDIRRRNGRRGEGAGSRRRQHLVRYR